MQRDLDVMQRDIVPDRGKDSVDVGFDGSVEQLDQLSVTVQIRHLREQHLLHPTGQVTQLAAQLRDHRGR